MAARQKNSIETLPLKLSTTRQIHERLDQLVLTGIFGKSKTEVAEELLRAKLREIEVPSWVTSTPRGGAS
jgi:hypothetical protein